MSTVLRRISAVLFIAALLAVTTLLVSDALNQLRFTAFHQTTGALAFILIGSSYIGVQLSSKRWPDKKLKDVLLGTAFVLWGSEQFLPPGAWVTVIDTLVVLIFVVDLSLHIAARLKAGDRDTI